jgi:hypothetical protein
MTKLYYHGSRCGSLQYGVVAGHCGEEAKFGRSVNQVYPLSLLAFAATAKALSLSRDPPSLSPTSPYPYPSPGAHHGHQHQRTTPATSCDPPTVASSCSLSGNGSSGSCSQVAGIDHCYRRHVKPKKQHEIKCLAEVGT